MKALSIAALMCPLWACTTPQVRQHAELMDLIEARVKLPEGARQLSEYARRYALDEKGFVVGVYADGYQAPNPDEACEEILEDFTTREVPCDEVEPEHDRLMAGQRQWVADTDKLPLILDGGCSVITVIFDPKTGEVKSATCNGVA